MSRLKKSQEMPMLVGQRHIQHPSYESARFQSSRAIIQDTLPEKYLRIVQQSVFKGERNGRQTAQTSHFFLICFSSKKRTLSETNIDPQRNLHLPTLIFSSSMFVLWRVVEKLTFVESSFNHCHIQPQIGMVAVSCPWFPPWHHAPPFSQCWTSSSLFNDQDGDGVISRGCLGMAWCTVEFEPVEKWPAISLGRSFSTGQNEIMIEMKTRWCFYLFSKFSGLLWRRFPV